jgi:hypothetical protein
VRGRGLSPRPLKRVLLMLLGTRVSVSVKLEELQNAA